MPVNFPQIQNQIRQMGAAAPREKELRDERLKQARQLLEEHSENLAALQARIEQAMALNQHLRCAAPAGESLRAVHLPPPTPAPYTLLAADGSQINPNRHDPVEYCVINLGAIRMQPGQPVVPAEITRSSLYHGEALRTPEGPLTEEIVAMRRDALERTLLAELAREESGLVLALTDGPLEPFRPPTPSNIYNQLLGSFIEALHDLQTMGVISAGYVDKPASDLVVRMLELLLLPEEDLRQAGQQHPLQGVLDAGMFSKYLPAGARTAVFAIQSRLTLQNFHDELALHFFYLNIGSPARPWLARVEIPAWVAGDAEKMDTLHATLLQQCQVLGGRAYPYALHRAHEVAVITLVEKEQLTSLIQAELARNGLEIGETSHKEDNKRNSGRNTRTPR